MLSQIANIVNSNMTRLEWDEYFMSIALLASCRSPCSRLHVGSVIIKSNRIVSMGYNGFIGGTPHTSHIRDGHEQAIIHSEINALGNSNRLGGTSLEGSTIYITHYPCINCFKSIASNGIKEIVYLNDYNNDPLIDVIATESDIRIRKMNLI
jgi:dCMP deaminase